MSTSSTGVSTACCARPFNRANAPAICTWHSVPPCQVGRRSKWFSGPVPEAKATRVPWIIQEAFPGYVVADQSRKLPEVPGQWVASLQVEGDPHPRLLILVEGTEEWKWILLQKGE